MSIIIEDAFLYFVSAIEFAILLFILITIVKKYQTNGNKFYGYLIGSTLIFSIIAPLIAALYIYDKYSNVSTDWYFFMYTFFCDLVIFIAAIIVGIIRGRKKKLSNMN